MFTGKKCHAFTLIELLVVISIIALLISILLPALQAAHTTAQLAVSLSNLRQISIAHHFYAEDYDGNLIFQTFDVAGSPSHQLPTWAGVLTRDGYTTDRSVYWSPGRDTSELNFNGDRFKEPEPWWYTGYGTNLWVSPTQKNYENASHDQPLTNLGHPQVPQHSAFLLMAEQSTDQIGIQMPDSLPGFYRTQAAPGTPLTWGYNLFTYNGAAAHAYLDGHASSDSSSIGWEPIDQFYGRWTLTGAQLKGSSWRKEWWK